MARSPTPEQLLELLWRQSPHHAFVLLGPDGVVLGWRGAAERLFGYTEPEIVGQPVDRLFTEEDRRNGIPALEREIAQADGRSEDDRWHLRKDGVQVWATGTVTPLRKGDKLVGFAKVMRERTDHRAQLETGKNRAESAERRVHERDEFFARFTHEVRNSLGPMKNAAQLLGREHNDHRLPLTILQRQVGVLERLVADMAELVRIGEGKLRLLMQTFDLAVDLQQLGSAMQPRVDAKGLTMTVLVPAGPVEICADRERIHQVVFNLLDNAIKYTPHGGRIWVKCTIEVASAVVRVQDDGEGISATLLPVIFDLFTQEDAHRAEGGFGVGLSLVKDLVRAHNGVVEARSDGKGKGSEFTIRLPLRGDAENPGAT